NLCRQGNTGTDLPLSIHPIHFARGMNWLQHIQTSYHLNRLIDIDAEARYRSRAFVVSDFHNGFAPSTSLAYRQSARFMGLISCSRAASNEGFLVSRKRERLNDWATSGCSPMI